MADLEQLKILPDLGEAPERIVSLVPSMTESLFTLGFGSSVVGVTEYCTQPAGPLNHVVRIGGTKNLDIEAIKSLDPQIVFANQEENTEGDIDALLEAGIQVWMTFPKNLDDTMDNLRDLLAIYHTDKPAMILNSLQMSLDWALAAAVDAPKVKYFCPIWMDATGDEPWWMTFNEHTYPHSLLTAMGGENIFADRERRYPLGADLGEGEGEELDDRDTRYPRVTQEEILEAEPDLILLPSEPFEFGVPHKEKLQELLAFTPAVRNDNIVFVDGSLITWHGVRLGKALQDLPELFFT